MPRFEPSGYAIELRDRDGALKARLEDHAINVSWEWRRKGGCGRCTIEIEDLLRERDVEADDDIRIYLPEAGGGAVLRYRGYVESCEESFTSTGRRVRLECDGYYGWARRVVAHEGVDEIIFNFKEMSVIAETILDDFLVPNSLITKGTIERGKFTADRITFKGYADDIFRALDELQGDVCYGVGVDLVFYWYNEVDSVRDEHKWYVGEHLTNYRSRTDYKNIRNDIFFEGGKVNDLTFTTRGRMVGSIDLYGLRQKIESSGNITTLAVANRLIKTLTKRDGVPRVQITAALQGYDAFAEDNLPIGKVEVIDPETFQDPLRYGEAGDGGSDITYGVGDYVYGSVRRHVVDRLRYQLNPEDGKINVEVQFGDSLNVSLASSRLRQMQAEIDAVRQRSL